MNRTIKEHTTLVAVAAAVAPVVLLELAPILKSGAGPVVSLAAMQPAAQPPAGPAAPNARQIAAAKHIASLVAAPTPASPFEVQPPPQVVVSAPQVEVVTPTPPSALPVPELTLKSIVAQASGDAIALINGKIYRELDEVAEGWTISDIDAESRNVVISSRDGQTAILSISTPPGAVRPGKSPALPAPPRPSAQ